MPTFNTARPIVLALLLNLVLFSLSLQAQDADTPRVQPSLAYLPLSDLELQHYSPKHTSSHELAKLARRLFGRSFYVEDDGATNVSPVENIQTIGDTLLIFDQSARLDELMKRLRTLDEVSESAPDSAQGTHYLTHAWSPGHVSLGDALSALSSYQRPLFPATSSAPNITTVGERNMLMLRDTQENLAEMLKVLEELDQPAPELLVSAMIVQGRSTPAGGDGPALPKALTDNLAQLVAYEHFEMLSMGFVRTSTRVGSVEVSMPADENRYFQLQLRPDSFDADGGTLTTQVRFSGNDRREIQTRTQIPVGEYTVIGASGRDPLFVVIKLSRADGDAH